MKTLALFYKMEARELQQLICPKYFYKVSLLPPTPQRAWAKLNKTKKPSQKFPELSEHFKKGTEKRSLAISGLPVAE